ncbi:hypothetical protein GC101_18080 [Paenibacillus sp. LMG 31459]|uniref:Type II secretion system protein GspF domain-containing protein n=1 Tax=Paenibacillus phytohabitans TaxID=2654978 RepID=A0ABX1YJW0_9BACL|nr:hypothetical protein [Paenibacillus phytohabitans]NOU80774.1 hypothetical protein [Paenibacillus phytohabitans]
MRKTNLSFLYAVAALIILMPALYVVMPGFDRQKKIMKMAILLNMDEKEIQKMEQNSIVISFADHLEKWKWLDFIFGPNTRKKYLTLNKSDSYPIFIAKLVLKALLFASLTLLLPVVTEMPILYLLVPLSVGLFIWNDINSISKQHKKRQDLLIRDLPNLISKMINALEVGKPLKMIFEKASNQGSDLLGQMLKRLIANSDRMLMKDALAIFAEDIDLPVMYDFVSVVNVILEKGFSEGEDDLNSIKDDLKELRKLSLIEITKGNPEKMNLFYGVLILHVMIFMGLMAFKLFVGLSAL